MGVPLFIAMLERMEARSRANEQLKGGGRLGVFLDGPPDDELLDSVEDSLPGWNFVGYTTVAASVKSSFGWSVQQSVNTLVNPNSNSSTLLKSQSFSSGTGNTGVGGADLVASFQQAISANSAATVNLAALTGIMQNAITPARVKSAQIRLLSATDDPSISPAPTSTSTVTVTNLGPATPHPWYFATGGSGLTVAMTVATGAVTGVSIGASGSGYLPTALLTASPQQVSGSGCVFTVTTNSSGVPTAVTFVSGKGGAGYSAATVPTVILGCTTLTTGNATCYVDVTAAGIVISSTSCNIYINNNDATHAVTVEIDLVLGST